MSSNNRSNKPRCTKVDQILLVKLATQFRTDFTKAASYTDYKFELYVAMHTNFKQSHISTLYNSNTLLNKYLPKEQMIPDSSGLNCFSFSFLGSNRKPQVWMCRVKITINSSRVLNEVLKEPLSNQHNLYNKIVRTIKPLKCMSLRTVQPFLQLTT